MYSLHKYVTAMDNDYYAKCKINFRIKLALIAPCHIQIVVVKVLKFQSSQTILVGPAIYSFK